MTKKRSLLIVLLGLIVALCLSFAISCAGEQVDVKWDVDEHVTVTVEGKDSLPGKVEKGSELKFTVKADNGYEVTDVKAGRNTIPFKDGAYTYKVNAAVEIHVKAERLVSKVEVSKNPTKLSYYAGESLDKAGMEVKVTYGTGESETVTNYTVSPAEFKLGDTEFTVSYGGKTSAAVKLESAVIGRVTLRAAGGIIADSYINKFAEDANITKTEKAEEGAVVYLYFEKALTEAVALPNATEVTRGTDGDYTLSNWQDDAGKNVSTVAKDTAVSVSYTAKWNAKLLTLTKVYFHLDESGAEQIPQLIVEGNYRAATSAYLYLYEGQAKVELVGPTIGGDGAKRGDAFKLVFDMRELVKKGYIGKWMDIKFVSEAEGGIKDTQEIRLSDYAAVEGFYDADDAVIVGSYRYHFEQDSGLLKACASIFTSVKYQISTEGDGTDDIAFVFTGTVGADSAFCGKVAVIDFYIDSTRAYYGNIGADGTFTVKVPLKEWGIGQIAYAHFSVIESMTEQRKLFPSSGEYNLPNADCTNTDFVDYGAKAPNGGNGDLLREGTIMIHNADYSRVFYIGRGLWGGIIGYGYNEKQSLEISGDVALKVDSMESPTKVYYVVKVLVGGRIGYTEDELKSIVFGDTNGGTVVYEQDLARFKKVDEDGKIYQLWFDVTAHAGKTMLWSNLYMKSGTGAEATYTKLLEIKDSDRSVNGLYAVVGGNKYSILCTTADSTKEGAADAGKQNTYNSCNLIVEKAVDGDTNPSTADPDVAETKYSFSLDYVNCELKEENGKPVLTIVGTVEGFKASDIYFDLQLNSVWSYIIFKDVATVEANGKVTIKVDFSNVPVESNFYLMHIELKPVLNDDGTAYQKEKDNVVHGEGGMTIDLAANKALLSLLQQKWPDADVGSTIFNVVVNKTSYSVTLQAPFGADTIFFCLEVVGDSTPTITINEDAVLEKDEAANKVYFTVTANVRNYTEEDLKKLCIGDISSSGVINQLFPCVSATILDGVATLKFDITDAKKTDQLYINCYDGNTAAAKKIQDIHRSSNNLSACNLGTKRYVLSRDLTYGSALLAVTDNAAPSLTPNSSNCATFEADAENGKAYLVVTGTATNFTVETLKALKLGNIDSSTNVLYDCVDAQLSGSEATLKFDITAHNGTGLYCNIYSGTTADSKVCELKDSLKSPVDPITVGGKTYSITYSQWNNVLLNAEEAGAPSYAITEAVLEKDETHVYFVIRGTSVNYDDAALKTVLEGFRLTVQHNDSWNSQGWDYVVPESQVVTVTKGAWTLKVDVTSVADGAYTCKLTTAAPGEAVTDQNSTNLEVSGIVETAQELGGKKYITVHVENSTIPKQYWGNIGFEVMASDTKVVGTARNDLEIDNNRVYYVLTVKAPGCTLEELQGAKLGDGAEGATVCSKVVASENGVYYKLYFDVTDLQKNELWTHLYINDIGYEGSDNHNGNIYADSINKTVTLNGKKYELYAGEDSYWITKILVSTVSE